jgi:hypothetical protein
MQIVENGSKYRFWISYGRVGVDAIGDSHTYDKGIDGCIADFEAKFVKLSVVMCCCCCVEVDDVLCVVIKSM